MYVGYFIMKTITLTQGQVALVDDADYDKLNKHKWSAVKSGKTYYATRIEYIPGGKGKLRINHKMHRVILGITDPKIEGEHENHNGLDNQRHNLRTATHSQNCMNRDAINKTSKYLGVHWDKESKKWKAALKFKGKQLNLGRYTDEKLAAEVYNRVAIIYHKEFANLNII